MFSLNSIKRLKTVINTLLSKTGQHGQNHGPCLTVESYSICCPAETMVCWLQRTGFLLENTLHMTESISGKQYLCFCLNLRHPQTGPCLSTRWTPKTKGHSSPWPWSSQGHLPSTAVLTGHQVRKATAPTQLLLQLDSLRKPICHH